MIDVVFASALGAIAGSAIACLVSRYLRGASLLSPARSHCDACGNGIAWYDNIPVLSFALLRGRCRSCRQRIPFSAVATEAIAALLCGGLVWRFSWSPTALCLCLFFLALLALSCVDWAILCLPDGLIAAAVLPALALAGMGALAPWPQPLYAALVGSGVLFALRMSYFLLRKKEGLGLGDVKLMAVLGFMTDVPGVFDSVFFAAVFGLIAAGLMRLASGRTPELLPFGPFLCLATYIKIMLGTTYAVLAG